MAVRDIIQAAAGVGGGDKLYVEDVFSTYLYTGNGSTQTITNGIDLAGEGGLTWIKDRTASQENVLYDTERGAGYRLVSNATYLQSYDATTLTSFNSNGFSLGSKNYVNASGGYNFASWTFRKAPKFFDVVTYTGNGVTTAIPHNLGSVPGCIIVKNLNSSIDWAVYHRSSAKSGFTAEQSWLRLNLTNAVTDSDVWGNTAPTDTHFYVGPNRAATNQSGINYVAYLFAHDAGGFGDDGTENIISCGSFNGWSGTEVNLGWEPQFILEKATGNTDGWNIWDTMRGMPVSSADATLQANTYDAEFSTNNYIIPTSQGFIPVFAGHSNVNYIYIAIRRGPMKTPESGTEVFSPNASSAATGTQITTGFPVDMQMLSIRTGDGLNSVVTSRLTGVSTSTTESARRLTTSNTDAEVTTNNIGRFWNNTGFQMPSYVELGSNIFWNFRRAPGFFDVVAYTGAGGVQTVTHSLGVAPELMIIKHRNGPDDWPVYHSALGNTKYLWLNSSNAESNLSSQFYWNNTTPTSSVFTLGGQGRTNDNDGTYIAYLFASCPGVSKVGSYTGNGTGQNIDCGFSAGARFVMIKKTNSTGNWTVFDTARGIVAGNDPRLSLDNTNAEITSFDYIDPYSGGFALNDNSTMNGSGDTYIFLAIA